MLWLFLSTGEIFADGKEVSGSCTKPDTSPKEEINGPPGMLIPSSNAVSSIPITSYFQVVFVAVISEQVNTPPPPITRTLLRLDWSNSIQSIQLIAPPADHPMPLASYVEFGLILRVQLDPPSVERKTKSPQPVPNWLFQYMPQVETITLLTLVGSILTPPY